MIPLTVAVAVTVIFLIVGRPWLRLRRRSRLAATALPPRERQLLESTRAYARLPAALQPTHAALVRVFLAEQHFSGCQGLEVTLAMRVEIASQACLLLLGGRAAAYGALRSILVYPDDFVVARREIDEAEVVTEYELTVSGEASDSSTVILSWQDVAAADPASNTVLHEFAHHLDHELGLVGGGDRAWAEAMAAAFDALRAAADADDPTLIDAAAADSPGEFFAFATETFFESPRALRDQDAALYAALSRVYQLDPAAW